ncbi:MAG: Alkaline phosphatase, partial [Jatrophihabitantaceae bacterium]|nr:Alkaline phosphatase [Jatrophihabitantaceae bacterium]
MIAKLGQDQAAMAGRIFAARLTAVVVTPEGVPVPDVRVTFTAPEAGPTARFTGGSRRVQVTTGPTGEATSPPVEAGLTGGTYAVAATVAGGSVRAVFPLTNTDPTVVAAGDIACAPGRETTPSRCQQMATSELAISLSPDAVLPLGDDQYEDGTLEEFAQYDASWGRLNAIAYPIPGNHEYGHGELVSHPSGAEGYFTYFGDRSHPLAPGCLSRCVSWYSYDLGAWHVIALDSECTQIGGCNPGNPQYEWLLDDLNRHQTQCTMVYWHIPLFSSSQDRQPAMKA